MTDPDRERSIEAYAGEVRAFHAFFGGVLLLLATIHLFALIPYLQVRGAAPALAAALATANVERAEAADTVLAVEAAAAGLTRFKHALDAAPGDLYRAALGAARAEPGIALSEDAIFPRIGRTVEDLGAALDGAIEPLRTIKAPPPAIGEAMRAAEETLGPGVLALAGILRDAFQADPAFWERLNGPERTFGPASPAAAEWTRRTAAAVSALERALTAAAAGAVARRDEAEARAAVLRERRRALEARRAATERRLAWLPLGPDGWMRLYPLVAGALALTVLFRLRRLLLLRAAHRGVDLDVLAPSWIVGPSTAPGRWWALVLVSLPVAATAHAAMAALQNDALFAGTLGEPDLVMTAAYALAYAVLVIAGLWQLAVAGRALVAGQRRRRGATEPAGR